MKSLTPSSEKRRKYTIFNIVLSCLVQVVSILVGLIIPHSIIDKYGDASNGLVSTVTQIFNFFQLLEGGVSVAAAVALYKPFSEGDTEKIKGIFRAIGRYYKKSGEILLGLSVATSVLFAFLFKDGGVSVITIMTVVMITGLMNTMNFLLLGKFNVVCDADQHTFVLHIFSITARVVVTVIQYCFIKLGLHLILVELPLLLSVSIRLLLTYLYVRKRYPYLLKSKDAEPVEFKQKNDALVIQIANLVKRNAPMIVLASTGNLVMLSIYNIYAQIFHATSSLFEMVSQSLTSNFGNLVVTESSEKVRRVYRKAEKIVFALVSVVFCCYFILTIPFFRVYTNGFETNYIFPVFAIIYAAAEGIGNLGVLPRLAAISCGYIKESRNPALIEALCSIAFGILGYILFDFNGLMLGCVIGCLFRTGYHLILVSGKIVPKNIYNSLTTLIFNGLFIAASIFTSEFVLKVIGFQKEITSYFSWFAMALIVFAISAIIIFGGNIVIFIISGKIRGRKNV